MNQINIDKDKVTVQTGNVIAEYTKDRVTFLCPIVDTLTRHTWPQEEPPVKGNYMVRLIYLAGLAPDEEHQVTRFEQKEWDGTKWLKWYREAITHWWDLPVVEDNEPANTFSIQF